MRKSLDFFGQDQAILTQEEVKHVRETVVEAIHHKLIGRDYFPVVENSHPGAKFYIYYTETDPSAAIIDMDGVAQADDTPLKTENEVKLPVIYKTALIPWRDVESSSRVGPSLLDDCARTLGWQVADAEDQLLLTGDTPAWPALGIEGLATRTGALTGVGGAWPANAMANINTGRAALQAAGFTEEEPVMIGQPAMVKCLDTFVGTTAVTYRQALLDNGLVSEIRESPNLFSATDGVDSVLLVIPGEDNFYMVESLPLTVKLWYDKMGSVHMTVREIVAPIIPRPTSIYQITGLTCP